MIRTVTDWKEILKDKSPEEAAKRIMGDLTHYYHGRTYEGEDERQLANAIRAFSSLTIDGD